MKILAIIQARTGSTRLPGKSVKKINGKPLIWYIVDTVKKSKLIDEIVLATTTKEKDKILIDLAKEYGVKSFAGDENNVLDRYYQAAKKFEGDIIVRLTGDCPLQDHNVIDRIIQEFLDNEFDYVSNTLVSTFPHGLDTEVFSFNALEKSWKQATHPLETEHVTFRIKKRTDLFSTKNVYNSENMHSFRWTVDYSEDFLLIEEILKRLGNKERNMQNILEIFEKEPELKELNRKVAQEWDSKLEKDEKIYIEESK